MTVPDPAPGPVPAAEARKLLRLALKGALATADSRSGYPYASLVTVASEPNGAPILLMSKLARHTRNLEAAPRACLLIDGGDAGGDPLQGARISLFGRIEPAADVSARRRFLARHAHAATYADFADFAFYRLALEGAHFVGGFGRIHELTADDLLIATSNAAALLAAEGDIVAHMNAEHAEALELYATRLLGAPVGAWRMTGCDPHGCDLLLAGHALRLDFPATVTTPEAARRNLASLARHARGDGHSAATAPQGVYGARAGDNA